MSVLFGLQNDYLTAIVAGDGRQASAVIDQALAREISPIEIYSSVILPAQIRLGALWHEGSISIAEEHLATEITLFELSRLRQLLRPLTKLGRRAVVSSVEGDAHVLGARVIGDFLFLYGWEVDFLGANTPAKELVRFAVQRKAALVCLSVTISDALAAAKRTISLLRNEAPEIRILVGGSGFTGKNAVAVRDLADGFAADPLEAVKLARALTDTAQQQSFEQYLERFGTRIQSLRKAKRWSQAELAEASSFDRTYISAVENGRQNITLSAVYKLAHALEVSIDTLLGVGENEVA